MREKKPKVRRSPVRKYNFARWALVMICLLTLINIALAVLDPDNAGYYLSSITLSYFLAVNESLPLLVAAIVIVALYFICYICSKKKGG